MTTRNIRHGIARHFASVACRRNRRRYNGAMRTAAIVLVMTIVLTSAAAAPTTAPTNAPSTAPAKIAEFQGDYRFLSNFWPAVIEFEGLTYPTVEHAYQSAKTLDLDERKRIAALPTPADAKAAGRALKLRDDWERAKFD